MAAAEYEAVNTWQGMQRTHASSLKHWYTWTSFSIFVGRSQAATEQDKGENKNNFLFLFLTEYNLNDLIIIRTLLL